MRIPARPFLNRYTSLPVLLDTLVHKRIVLLKPSTWEDRNDSFYLERYKEEKNLKTVLALCFSLERETFHHWKVFASGSSGVCIEFDKAKLLNGLRPEDGYTLRNVDYAFIKDVKAERPELEAWPFLKRKPFKDEREFRIVYENKTKKELTKDIPIKISCILKVTLSPWLPYPVAETVKGVIKQLPGCQKITVIRSSLLETADWKSAIKTAKFSKTCEN
jgi:hypothetical protein